MALDVRAQTVNAKGLDIRLRMPSPFDQAEGAARTRLASALARGTCFANLSARREAAAAVARIDSAALGRSPSPPARLQPRPGLRRRLWMACSLCAAWSISADAEDDEATVNVACADALATLDEAIASLTAARRVEGAALAALLTERLDAIAALADAADANPARRPEAVRERLAQNDRSADGVVARF